MENAPSSEQPALTQEANPRGRSPALLVAGFLVLTAMVVALAVFAWREQARSMRATTDRGLMAVAHLKSSQISAWLGERHADARVVRSDKLLAAAVGDILSDRGGPAAEAGVGWQP